MRNHFDHLAKDLGQALGPLGVTVVNDPIDPETQYADPPGGAVEDGISPSVIRLHRDAFSGLAQVG